MKLKDIISEYRTENNLTQRDFARKCKNISHAYVSIIENDYNPMTKKQPQPSMEKLEALAAGMNITLDQLLQKMGRTPKTAPQIPNMEILPYTPARAMVPVIGSVRCGPGGLAFEELQGAELADVANPNEYFYLRADGDSMEPDIRPGDLVLVHRQPEVESGALAVVIINGEEGTLKRISYKPGAVILTAINPAYPPRILIGEEINDIII